MPNYFAPPMIPMYPYQRYQDSPEEFYNNHHQGHQNQEAAQEPVKEEELTETFTDSAEGEDHYLEREKKPIEMRSMANIRKPKNPSRALSFYNAKLK